MKISKKKLIKLIKETIYVDPKGVGMKDSDVELSVLDKDRKISQLHPKLAALMKGQSEDRTMARELARSGMFNDDSGSFYHGAEEMYVDNPAGFRSRVNPTGFDDYYLIIFDIYCDYEGADFYEDDLYEYLDAGGIVCGELPAGSLPGEKYTTKYAFGTDAQFNGDPYNFLESLLPYIDERASDGGNRPCYAKIQHEKIIELGYPTDYSDLLRSVLINNSQGLNKNELAVARIALTQNYSSGGLQQLKQMGVSNPEDVVNGLVQHFMAMAAQKEVGLTTNTIVDATTYAYPDHMLDSENVYD